MLGLYENELDQTYYEQMGRISTITMSISHVEHFKTTISHVMTTADKHDMVNQQILNAQKEKHSLTPEDHHKLKKHYDNTLASFKKDHGHETKVSPWRYLKSTVTTVLNVTTTHATRFDKEFKIQCKHIKQFIKDRDNNIHVHQLIEPLLNTCTMFSFVIDENGYQPVLFETINDAIDKHYENQVEHFKNAIKLYNGDKEIKHMHNNRLHIYKHIQDFFENIKHLLVINTTDTITYDYAFIVMYKYVKYLIKQFMVVLDAILAMDSMEPIHASMVDKHKQHIDDVKQEMTTFIKDMDQRKEEMDQRLVYFKQLTLLPHTQDDFKQYIHSLDGDDGVKDMKAGYSKELKIKEMQIEEHTNTINELIKQHGGGKQFRRYSKKSRHKMRNKSAKQRQFGGGIFASALRQESHRTTNNENNAKSLDGGNDIHELDNHMHMQSKLHQAMEDKAHKIKQSISINNKLLNLNKQREKERISSCLEKHMHQPGNIDCAKDCLSELKNEKTGDINCKCKPK